MKRERIPAEPSARVSMGISSGKGTAEFPRRDIPPAERKGEGDSAFSRPPEIERSRNFLRDYLSYVPLRGKSSNCAASCTEIGDSQLTRRMRIPDALFIIVANCSIFLVLSIVSAPLLHLSREYGLLYTWLVRNGISSRFLV